MAPLVDWTATVLVAEADWTWTLTVVLEIPEALEAEALEAEALEAWQPSSQEVIVAVVNWVLVTVAAAADLEAWQASSHEVTVVIVSELTVAVASAFLDLQASSQEVMVTVELE